MTGQAARFIVLEGVDAAALAALSERLYRWLRDLGHRVERTSEPTHGPMGAQLLLAGQERLQFDPLALALLDVADRMDHLEREGGILSWLGDGRHVLCARYMLHALACRWVEVDRRWLWQIHAPCRVPDLTLFIDTPPLSSCRSLRQAYLDAIASLGGALGPVATVEDRGDADEIYQACCEQVLPLIGR